MCYLHKFFKLNLSNQRGKTMKSITKLTLTATLALAITFTFNACEEKQAAKPTTEPAAAEAEARAKAEAEEADRAARKPVLGTFTDTRDSKTYKTVKIGTQIWMAENLNFEAKGSKCYDNKPDNCKKYGRLYDWETAKKACPSGWHLPSGAEWQTLVNFAGGDQDAGRNLKANSGWDGYCDGNDEDGRTCFDGDGADSYGFSALPGGSGGSNGFSFVGESGYWWTAEAGGDGAYCRKMDLYRGSGSDYVYKDNVPNEGVGFSVRCIQN
jgi:uncharacterized protein (TIGR02145 family)